MRPVLYASLLAYLLLILAAVAFGKVGSAVFNLGVLFVLVIATFVFRKNAYTWPLVAATLLFVVPAIASIFFGYVMKSSVFGEDKIFHMLGGAVLAWFMLVALKDYVEPVYMLALSAVAFTVMLSAWWEVYEWALLVLKNDTVRLTLADSLLDIVADTAGAVVVVLVFVQKRKR